MADFRRLPLPFWGVLREQLSILTGFACKTQVSACFGRFSIMGSLTVSASIAQGGTGLGPSLIDFARFKSTSLITLIIKTQLL
jgi:hypothetical protein